MEIGMRSERGGERGTRETGTVCGDADAADKNRLWHSAEFIFSASFMQKLVPGGRFKIDGLSAAAPSSRKDNR